MTSPSASLVLVRGVMVRSGTNFLRDLLVRHPDCAPSRAPIWEDFFLDEGHHLRAFVDGVADRWPGTWGIDRPDATSTMMAALGAGLVEFLRGDATAPRIVAKTPSPVGLDHVGALFPDARVLLLVRDGRAVVDSTMRSFGWGFERAVHTWDAGARRVIEAMQPASPSRSQCLVVRYEELVGAPEQALPTILGFLGLDGAGLPADVVRSLPVRGSSESAGDGGPDWQPRERDAAFDPLRRGVDWDDRRLERFAWVAGASMGELGYDIGHDPGSAVEHRLRDAGVAVESRARGLVRRVRRRGR